MSDSSPTLRPQPDEETIAFAGRVFQLARSGGAEQMRSLLAQGLPPNLRNDKGDTLLLLAAYYDSPATVRALLARGADPDRVNDRGQTSLAAAVFCGSAESVQALLAAGASPHVGGPDAVETARFFGLTDMQQLLDGARPSG